MALSYSEAVQYIFYNANYKPVAMQEYNTRRPRDFMLDTLRGLGNPHKNIRVVHVAGTNGKGSICAMIDRIIRGCGLRCGLFTSPHLHSIRERFRVDGKLISRDDFASIVSSCKPIFDAVGLEHGEELHPFQKMTLIAMKYFSQLNVDYVVLEVGLGGRLDPTNIFDGLVDDPEEGESAMIQPSVTAIAAIGLDHCHILGDTHAKIAAEKAGIMKPGVPCFTFPQRDDVLQVFSSTAKKVGATLRVVDVDRRISSFSPQLSESLSLHGAHQWNNARVVQEIASYLFENKLLSIPDSCNMNESELVSHCLHQVRWPGRFERLPIPRGHLPSENLNMIVDCAHNEQALSYVASELNRQYRDAEIVIILGVNKDKQISEYSSLLQQCAKAVVLVKANHPKAVSVADLQIKLNSSLDSRLESHLSQSPVEAIKIAQGLILDPTGGLIVGVGSVFVATELRSAWNEMYPDAFPENDWVHEAALEPAIGPS